MTSAVFEIITKSESVVLDKQERIKYKGKVNLSLTAEGQWNTLSGCLPSMTCLKFTTDETVKRLCWVMVGVILFDDINTLLGQPATFWQHPETADEFNRLTHFFISHGWAWYCVYELFYIGGAFFLARILPRRLGLVILLALILGHFDGGSSWLAHRWHFGTQGMVIYGIILAVILVLSAFPQRSKSNEKIDSV